MGTAPSSHAHKAGCGRPMAAGRRCGFPVSDKGLFVTCSNSCVQRGSIATGALSPNIPGGDAPHRGHMSVEEAHA